MATNAHRILENFKWKIESISPTATKSSRSFKHIDVLREQPSTSNNVRSFSVQWIASEEDVDLTDMTDRVSRHIFDVEVYYPVGPSSYKVLDCNYLILQDRHDILKALRSQESQVGYSDDNSTTDIGLMSRVRMSDAKEMAEDLFILKITFICLVREQEY